MAYDLDAFCHDCRDALKADTGPGGREAVRRNLEKLLAEKAFVDQHVLAMPPGRHTLYEDPDLGFVVLSHVNTKAVDVAAARSRRVVGDLRPGDRTTPT